MTQCIVFTVNLGGFIYCHKQCPRLVHPQLESELQISLKPVKHYIKHALEETSTHKTTNFHTVYASTERRFKVNLLCYAVIVSIWKSKPLHLVLKAATTNAWSEESFEGTQFWCWCLCSPVFSVLCLGFASVVVSWAWLSSISTCWMHSLPDPSTRGFFACKCLSLLPSDFSFHTSLQGTSTSNQIPLTNSIRPCWEYECFSQIHSASSWLGFLSAGAASLLIALSKQPKTLPNVCTKDRCLCNNKGS